MIQFPSSKSVVIQSNDESRRIELMKTVTEQNFVTNVTGIRIRDDGTYIRLVNAVVWNCFNITTNTKDGADGNNDEEDDNTQLTYIGQAAFFDRTQCPILESLDEEE